MKALITAILFSGWQIPEVPPDPKLPTTFEYTCDAKCFKLVGAAKEFDCGMFKVNLYRALEAFDHHGPVKSTEACLAMRNTTVRIRDDDWAWADDDYGDGVCRTVTGMHYWPTGYIEVARDLGALAHEMLHAYEHNSKAVTHYGEHPGTWDDNPEYMQMLQEFEAITISVDGVIMMELP